MSYAKYYTTNFDSDGKIFMIENALIPLNDSTPLVALRTNEGIIIALKKEGFEKLEIVSKKNIYKVSDDCFLGITGLDHDIDQVVSLVRQIAHESFSEMGFSPTPDILARKFADDRQARTMRSGIRPFSFSAVIFGVEQDIMHLWHTDTSSTLYMYHAIAIGKNQQKMNKFLEKNYKNCSLEEALMMSIMALSESIGNDFSPDIIDVCYITKENKLRYLDVEEIDILLQKIADNE